MVTPTGALKGTRPVGRAYEGPWKNWTFTLNSVLASASTKSSLRQIPDGKTTMILERSGRKYELVKGSDIDSDTLHLELNEITDGEPRNVLFGEKTEAGEYRLVSLQHLGAQAKEPIMLPLDLVEDFIAWMKERL